MHALAMQRRRRVILKLWLWRARYKTREYHMFGGSIASVMREAANVSISGRSEREWSRIMGRLALNSVYGKFGSGKPLAHRGEQTEVVYNGYLAKRSETARGEVYYDVSSSYPESMLPNGKKL